MEQSQPTLWEEENHLALLGKLMASWIPPEEPSLSQVPPENPPAPPEELTT